MNTVLVVEDDGIIALDIQETLKRLGYHVPLTVDCCEDALAAVDRVSPDLVLMDIQLRGALDGIATASRIRARADVPVVYLTSHSDEATLARAKETGPYGYLVKPFNERDLRTAIEVAIRKRELERHLADRERWFSTTLESLGDAVIATDSTGSINFMNPVAEKITGFSSAEAKGRPLHEVFRLVDEKGARLDGPANRSWRSQFAVALPTDVHLVDRTGASKLVDDHAAPIIDEHGKLLGGVIVFRDISHQKRLERRLAISERMAAVGTMAAGLAHEVNNPLAAVVGNVTFAVEELRVLRQMVRALPGAEELLGPRVEEVMLALADATTSADRVHKIVHTMRWFGRPHAASRQVVDLPDIIEPALCLTENTLRHKARLVRAYGTTPFVEVDDGQLLQVLTNLLANAADAITDGNAAANEIRIGTATDERGRAVVTVKDTGVGIAPADLARVFDPFFTTKGVGAGMGLGLSISHGFVVTMGGEMTIESAVGRGTTITVTLPAATREKAEPPGSPVLGPAARRARVLVIDDEKAVANAVRRVLRDHDVVVETDGRAACARVQGGERFDVVFCDLMMPNMSGPEVFETLRRLDPATAERMVFLTGGAFSPGAAEFLESVANVTIAKPFRADALRGVVRDYVK